MRHILFYSFSFEFDWFRSVFVDAFLVYSSGDSHGMVTKAGLGRQPTPAGLPVKILHPHRWESGVPERAQAARRRRDTPADLQHYF